MTVPMKIFVSYSRSVKTEVGKIIDLLSTIGHEVWWDGDIPLMADWWATILDKIEWCQVFIFVVSEKSVQSDYCLAELKYATERNRPILPFVMDDHTKYFIPPVVTPMRAQWYIYQGDANHMASRLEAGIANVQWEKYHDIYAKRPPEPNTNTTSVIKQFQDARKLAYAGNFDEAKTAFRNVKSLDFREWGQECDEWVERINRYVEIYELAGDTGTVSRAVKKWNDFKGRYGTDFDPFDLVNNPPVIPAPTPPPMPKPVYIPPRTEPIPESIKPALKPITPPQEEVVQPKPTPEPTKPPPQNVNVVSKPIVDVAQPPPMPVYTPPPKPSEKPLKNDFAIPRTSAGGAKQSRSMLVIGGVLVTVIVLIVILVSILNNQSNTPLVSENSTPTDTAELTATFTIEPTDLPTSTDSPTPTDTTQPTATNTDAPTPTNTTQPTATNTDSPTPTNTTQPTATNTDAPTPTNTTQPIATISSEIGFIPITRNEDWTPFEQEFDGVTMVLVPAGCFMMGSETGADNEKPVYEQCFDTPFWIDKYEVTQAQFAQFGGQKANENEFTGGNRPIERITWFEARNYCVLRGGRLPTEREWEYAARGPSNLIYPWGNDFVPDNVVYYSNSNNQTADVGSHPNGVSWVGALDMSGNVYEWVSSLYGAYPYDETDESVSDNNIARVLRGGSWDGNGFSERSVSRGANDPNIQYNIGGFRCVRSQ